MSFIFLTKITLSGSMGIFSALAPQIFIKTKKKKGHKGPFFKNDLETRMNISNQLKYFFPYHVYSSFSILTNDQHIPCQTSSKPTKINLNHY